VATHKPGKAKTKTFKRAARGHVVLKAHHRKPFRKRQLVFLSISLLVLAAAVLKLGANIGNRQAADVPVVQTSAPTSNSVTVVRSTYGFSMALDGNTFAVTGTELTDAGVAQNVSQNQLHQGSNLTSVTVRPRIGTVPRSEAANQLSVVVNPSTAAYASAKASAPATASPGEIAATLFTQSPTNEYDVSILATKADTLNGIPVLKTTYQYSPKFSGGTSYAVVWTGTTGGRAFAVKLQGLVGSSNVPASFSSVFDSLTIVADQGVLGAFSDIFAPKAAADPAKLNTKYLSDALSPAVVKIYHIVCGTLMAYGQTLVPDTCVGFSGSGFIATSDGYIATNGHVVQYSAKDRLVDILTASPTLLNSFLKGFGLSDAQVGAVAQDPATLASIISKIYDIPDANLNFGNANEATLVALGVDVPKFTTVNTSKDLDALKKNTDTFKVATVIGYNYSSRDMLTAIANPKVGFTASDVALLKINVKNAPTISISKGQVTQNEKIAVMGFPGDADNGLTDNTSLAVSVTDGVISSIRQAAGHTGKLYQSDADASHGNSGGPAIDETGSVIGLLTYRQSGDSAGNAAKSYIRDILDFTELASSKDIKIDSTSTTQVLWQEGLQLFSESHYSAALKKFDAVSQAYPAHRLVGDYIASSKGAIANGKDVKSVSTGLIIVAISVAVVGTIVAVVLIIRHRVRHHLYKAYQPAMPDGAPSPAGFAVPATVPPATPITAPAGPAAVAHEVPLQHS
jgi:S1-C subfamily serine protease